MPVQPLEQAPDYAMMALDNLFVVLWRVNTTMEGVEKSAAHLASLGARHPKGIGLVTLIPAKAPPPPGEVRTRLARVFSEAINVKGSAVCFEGSGLRASIVRSVVTGLTILSQPAFPHRVFSTLQTGVEFVNQHLTAAGAPALNDSRVVNEIEAWRRALT